MNKMSSSKKNLELLWERIDKIGKKAIEKFIQTVKDSSLFNAVKFDNEEWLIFRFMDSNAAINFQTHQIKLKSIRSDENNREGSGFDLLVGTTNKKIDINQEFQLKLNYNELFILPSYFLKIFNNLDQLDDILEKMKTASALKQKMVSGIQLKNGGTFFRGNHALPTGLIENAFSDKAEVLEKTGAIIGGTPIDDGDCGFNFFILPGITVSLIFYDRDEEFDAKATFLFNEHILDFVDLDIVLAISENLALKLKKFVD